MKVYKEGDLTVVDGMNDFVLTKNECAMEIGEGVSHHCFRFLTFYQVIDDIRVKFTASREALKFIWGKQ